MRDNADACPSVHARIISFGGKTSGGEEAMMERFQDSTGMVRSRTAPTVLILSSTFGMGHMSCARALREMILQDEPTANVVVMDFMHEFMPEFSSYVYRTFNHLVSRRQRLYNRLNLMAGHLNMAPCKNMVVHRLKRTLRDIEPDLVISSTPLCAHYVSAAKRHASVSDLPLFIYVTDVTFHREWMAKRADLYFVGDESTKRQIEACGVDASDIHVCGVPVSSDFTLSVGLPDVRRKVLVMGGGLGLLQGCEVLLDALEASDCEAVLVCGTNHEMEQWARKRYRNIQVLGFTHDIPRLMAQSKLVVTKPGGITVFEAIKSCTPICALDPKLEQEMGNARFIRERGIGTVVHDLRGFSHYEFMALVHNESLLAQMRERMFMLGESFEEANPLSYLDGSRAV